MIENERQEKPCDAADGVRVTCRQVSAGAWAFSGVSGDRIVYQRAGATCGGTAAAILHAEDPVVQKALFGPVILRTAQTLHGSNRSRTPSSPGSLKASEGLA